MPADVPVAGPRVLPALLGPRRLRPFRARRLALPLVGAPTGAPDRAVARSLREHVSGSHRHDVVLDDEVSLHVHDFTIEGRQVRGVVGLLDLGGEQVLGGDRTAASLLPHEGVDPDRAARLADRMAELALDPAPLLLLHRASTGQHTPGRLSALLERASAPTPDHEGRDARGGRHRLWTVRDPGLAGALAEVVAGGTMLLADGHHRLAAHLALASRDPAVGDGHALAMVSDDESLAPHLAPIHRTLAALGRAAVVKALEAEGHTVVPAPSGTPVVPPRDVAADQLLVVDSHQTTRVQVRSGSSRTVVEALHAALDPVVGDPGWVYHHDATSAEDAVAGACGVAIILPPSSIDQAWQAAAQGRLLPAKATSFQPKPPLGVLLRSWRDA